ncbi:MULTISPECIES: ABC transporter permease [Pseudomonas]|jgi:ABC-type nitrate/sulfonate/bicarbonate transport system permease component|uniref:ABC transporter permease n=1 Tax=Pseudomonas TaxID=286 RepID=UPI0009961200|nr:MULTISPECIES: ABC transporter permease [Pseudomonas]MBG8560320.1 ABC transporter permease [Pseudomonas qingdaonensis]MCO7503536.1 ABC transporter permease [Pseudomonas sp. VE 267-6A]MCO7529090.1 ABC transporter permease [Pseudomonas sp. 2]MCQ0169182.1 ABC transporter permease [Pseudomonas sp. S12(2018)]OOV97736.1 ABC transporter permease [Pseudomonas sp. MF6396]
MNQAVLTLSRQPDARRAPRYLDALRDTLWFLLAWALLIGAWELAVQSGWLDGRVLPPPSVTLPYAFSGEAVVGFGQQRSGLLEALLVTLLRVSGGLLAGSLVALLLAVITTEVKLLRRLILPLVQTLAPISPVAWVPFTIAVIGIGGQAAVFVVFLAVLGTMTLSLVAALDAIDPQYLNIARNLRCTRQQIWLRVRLPAIAPSAMTSLRMAFFGAWMAVLAGEMAGINSGLGYMIIMAQQMYNMPLVMVGVMTIGVVGFVVDRLMLLLGRRLTGWAS